MKKYKIDYIKDKIMSRPESAYVGSKSKHNKNRTLNSVHNQTFNKSSNQIIRAQNVQNLEEVSEYMQEIKSEQQDSKDKKLFNKIQLVQMLMKIELQKMGFAGTRQLNIMKDFLMKKNIQQVQIKHLKRWVLSTKSQIVQLLLKQPNINEQNSEISSLRSKSFYSSTHQMRVNLNEDGQTMQQNRNIKVVQANILKISAANESKQENKAPIKKILCPICLQQTTHYLQRKCGHIFCNLCFQTYILENISIGNYIIECAEYECSQKVSQLEAAKLLEPKDLERFIKFKQKIELQMNPNNKFCNRPDCGNLLVLSENNKLQCKKCKVIFCELCQQGEHPGQGCNQIVNEALNNTYSQFKIKKCPTCGSPIQKIDGCNHMICKKCKCEFCWICLQLYTPYHYRIYNCCGCPGLQFEDIENMSYKRFLQAMFFIFFPILLVIWIGAVIGLLPFYIVFSFFIKPIDWLEESNPKCQIELLNAICCQFPNCCLNIIGYLMLIPRSAIYAVFSQYLFKAQFDTNNHC